jgi:hypothetical protein
VVFAAYPAAMSDLTLHPTWRDLPWAARLTISPCATRGALSAASIRPADCRRIGSGPSMASSRARRAGARRRSKRRRLHSRRPILIGRPAVARRGNWRRKLAKPLSIRDGPTLRTLAGEQLVNSKRTWVGRATGVAGQDCRRHRLRFDLRHCLVRKYTAVRPTLRSRAIEISECPFPNSTFTFCSNALPNLLARAPRFFVR